MPITVLVERIEGGGYRATSGPPLAASVEGSTRDEALWKLRGEIEGRLSAGASLVSMDFPGLEHPLAPFAGDLKDDPLLEEWKEAMAEYRRSVDSDPAA
jgi:hypothetical protein